MLRCKNAVGCMEHPVSLIVGEASAAARAMSGDSCELPPPLRAFLAARRTLDDLLRLDHYQGRGEAARHQAAATAAWVESGRQGVAPVAAFADSLFAKASPADWGHVAVHAWTNRRAHQACSLFVCR